MQQNNIVGYTMQGQPIFNTTPQATPRLVAPSPTMTGQNQIVENPMIWVDGYIEAKSYRVAPGSTVVLWDSQEGSNRIYIKSTDETGIPKKMKTLVYTEVDEDEKVNDSGAAGGIVSVDVINDMIESKFEELFEAKMKERKQYRPNHNKNRREEDRVNEK